MDDCPYRVYDQNGKQVYRSPESCRATKDVELHQLNKGYTIKLHGKRITKKEVQNRV